MDYQGMWGNLKYYIEEMKSFAENIDTKGDEKAQVYKDGLTIAYQNIDKTVRNLEEHYGQLPKK